MPGASKKDATIEARRLIRNCVLFQGLNDSERSAISACARIRAFEAGESIFAIGCPGDQMMAVPTGTVRFSQRELASMVGGTRESVNKCLRKWQTGGIVRISESWIAIMDRSALENIAEHG